MLPAFPEVNLLAELQALAVLQLLDIRLRLEDIC